jgi:hypothetical protein
MEIKTVRLRGRVSESEHDEKRGLGELVGLRPKRYCTTSVTDVECEVELVPVIVTVYVPDGVPGVTGVAGVIADPPQPSCTNTRPNMKLKMSSLMPRLLMPANPALNKVRPPSGSHIA